MNSDHSPEETSVATNPAITKGIFHEGSNSAISKVIFFTLTAANIQSPMKL